MRPGTNPCVHDWELMLRGHNGIHFVDAYRCDKCLEVRHAPAGAPPETGAITMPGHYKCAEHGRYNCAEEHT